MTMLRSQSQTVPASRSQVIPPRHPRGHVLWQQHADHQPIVSRQSDTQQVHSTGTAPWGRVTACMVACMVSCVAAPQFAYASTTDPQATELQLSWQTEQRQPDTSQQSPTHAPNLLATLAGLFEERDPIEAFTLYGTTFKKFVIEVLDGEKVVSRKRGFTVDTCVASARQSEETPSFRFLPVGEKVRTSENTLCKHAEGADLKLTCYQSCELACTAGLERWAESNSQLTGFALLDKDKTRLLKNCARECTQDCTRPGKAYDFVVTYRK